jgi:hypothetical protein
MRTLSVLKPFLGAVCLTLASLFPACAPPEEAATTAEPKAQVSLGLSACTSPRPPPQPCGDWQCLPADNSYELIPAPAGQACGTNRSCDGQGSCVSAAQAPAQVTTDAQAYNQNHPIAVTWSGLPGNAKDWVAYAPVGSAPTTVTRWVYTAGQAAGQVVLEGTLVGGRYVARAFTNDSYTMVAESSPFDVGGGAQAAAGDATTLVTAIVPGAGAIASYVGYAESAYRLFLAFATKQQKVPSDLDSIKAAIAASTAAIAAHDDALVNGMIRACVDDANIALAGITTMSPDAQMAAATAAVHCTTLAKNEIAAEGAAGVDTLGLALNTVGPVALFMQAYVGQPTDILLGDIIFANQQILARLQPVCGVSSEWSPTQVNQAIGATGGIFPGDWDHVAVPGRGACYNYTHAAPPTSGVVVFPTGDGTGRDPWQVIGDGVPEICLGVFLCGAHVDWQAGADHSIAATQAMANTSYPVAAAALHRLLPNVAPAGAPIAMAATVNDRTGAQFFSFGVDPDGTLFASPMAIGVVPQWTAFVGAPELKSLAAATNADGRIEVFGIDRTGAIFHSWQLGDEFGSWSGWATMDGQLASIAVARNWDGTLQVFGTTPSGTIFTRNQILNADYHPSRAPSPAVPSMNSWTPWRQMQGILTSISAVTDDNGLIEVFGVSGGNLFQRQQLALNATDPNVNWSGWINLNLPPAFTHSMAVVRDTLGRLQFFASSGSAVYQAQRSPEGYWDFSWTVVPPGSNITGVAAVTTGSYSVLLGVSPGGLAYTDVSVYGSMGGWMGWGPVSGASLRPFN